MLPALVSPSAPPLRRIWWLHPTWLICCAVIPTSLAAWLQSEHGYQLHRSPKYMALFHLSLVAGALAAFAMGRLLGDRTGRVPQPTSQTTDDLVRRWFYLAFALTLFGYAVWFAVGFKNGFSPGVALQFLTSDDPELHDWLHKEVFTTIPGVTTCSQFGVGASLLGAWLVLRGDRSVRWPLAALVGLSVVRALLFSERLALIEQIVPLSVVGLRLRVLGASWIPPIRWSLLAAPVFAVAGLFVLFGFFEYFRSWRWYQNDFSSYGEFVVWRLTGYYTTAINNGAMAWDTRGQWPYPYGSLHAFWNFPLVERSPFAFDRLTGYTPLEAHERTLELFGNPEMNNDSGIFTPLLDFGVLGSLVFWVGYGFLAGRLYRSFLVGTLAGVTIYPLMFLSLIEMPRIFYLTSTRVFPTLALLVLVGWLVSRPRPLPAPGDAALALARS